MMDHIIEVEYKIMLYLEKDHSLNKMGIHTKEIGAIIFHMVTECKSLPMAIFIKANLLMAGKKVQIVFTNGRMILTF